MKNIKLRMKGDDMVTKKGNKNGGANVKKVDGVGRNVKEGEVIEVEDGVLIGEKDDVRKIEWKDKTMTADEKMLLLATARRQSDDKAKVRQEQARAGHVRQKRFEEAKKRAFEMEKGNNDKLIVFIAKGGWYKMGGRSALIYYHTLAKRLGLKPQLNPDTDFFSKFKEGIVSIRDIDTLRKNLWKLKISKNTKLSTENGELVVFDLGYKISEEDFEIMMKSEETRKKKINKMILPKVVMPQAHAESLALSKALYSHCRKMNKVDRELFSTEIFGHIRRIYTAIHYVSKGVGNEQKILREAGAEVVKLKCMINMMGELSVWSLDACLRMMESATKIETLIWSRMAKMEKGKDENEQSGKN